MKIRKLCLKLLLLSGELLKLGLERRSFVRRGLQNNFFNVNNLLVELFRLIFQFLDHYLVLILHLLYPFKAVSLHGVWFSKAEFSGKFVVILLERDNLL